MTKAVANREISLRKTASANTKIIDIIPEGESVSVLEKIEKWVKVDYNDQEGYVSTTELNFGGSTKTSQAKLETKDIETQAEEIIEDIEDNSEIEESDSEETPVSYKRKKK